MNQVSTYQFGLQDIRVVDLDGQPWFAAKDVFETLGLHAHPANGSYQNHYRRLAPDELHNPPIGFKSRSKLVSESGLYKLIMRSNKPEARAFQDWVTRVVLPAIRKDGAYIQGEEKVATGELSEDDLVLKAIGILQRKVDRLANEKAALQHQVDHLTVRQYETALGTYLSSSTKTRLSVIAKGYCAEQDIPVERAPMAFTDTLGTTHHSYANVYPRAALDYAAKALGVAA